MTTTAANASETRRNRAATLALAATLFLSAIKFIVATASGSIGVLSEAIHSGLDLLSSLVTFFSIKASARPADWDHPFGHGKLENLSALLESFLLMVAGGYIIYEGLMHWTNPHPLNHMEWALGVTGVSVVVNLFVYFQNRHVAREEESIAIETNAFHFLTDVFSSLAVFVGLGLVQLTGIVVFDVVVALLIAVYVFWIAFEQMKKCIDDLSDSALPSGEVTLLRSVLEKHDSEFLGYHDLRTRKGGSVRHADLHLTVCSEQTVADAHAVCDRIEEDMMKLFKEIQVNIHVEPCGTHGPECGQICQFTKKPRLSHGTKHS